MDEHRAAFEYDWRSRFHMALADVPRLMGWGEAWRLTALLAADPSSQVGAAFAGWAYPAQRVDLVMRDLFDLQHKSKTPRKTTPYPRPWDSTKRTRIGGTTRLSIADFEAIKARNMTPSEDGAAHG